MTNGKLSVIIPIYNVAKYLAMCIDSVINQTYKNMEIILIDDGSTDGSEMICDNYIKIDNRIKVFHKSNEGQSSARNLGLDVAEGTYITFLDSDDWVDKTTYEELINLINKYDCDIASCGKRDIYPNKVIESNHLNNIIIFDSEEAICGLLTQKYIRFEVWNKIYRKDVIGNNRFKKGQLYEEIYFDKCVFLKMNKLVHFDKPLYNYLKIRDGNTNSEFKPEQIKIFDEINLFIHELINLNMIKAAKCIQAFALSFNINMYLHAQKLNASKLIKTDLLKIFKKLYIESKNNEYVDKYRVLIFKISPSFYTILVKLKKLLINRT